MSQTFERNQHTVELSSQDRVLFPETGLTKGDLIDYYKRVCSMMLPYLKDRPMMMQRSPEGLKGEAFYQKSTPDYFPDWIETVVVDKKTSDEQQELVLCNNVETLVYLVNQGCLTFHPWLSRKDRLHEPDRAVIDLDPAGADDALVKKAARVISGELREMGLRVFVTTTGSSGYHLVLPLRRGKSFDQVRQRLAELSADFVKRHPHLFTTEQRKAKRGGKIYLDIARNAYAQTSVSIYSVRLKQEAPVATPLDLQELERSDLHPQRYNVKNLFRRLAQKKDPWREMWGGATNRI